jgi:hypothetical protein
MEHYIHDIHPKLTKFIEEVYCVKYNPARIRPQYHKNTQYHKYFVFVPMGAGWGESEFYYDMEKNKFVRVEYEVPTSNWDSSYDDVFS